MIKRIPVPLSHSFIASHSFQIKVVAVVISVLFNEHISSPPTCLFRAAHIKELRKNLDCCCDEDTAYRSVIPALPRASVTEPRSSSAECPPSQQGKAVIRKQREDFSVAQQTENKNKTL